MAEEGDDVKPKLNINVEFEGQSEYHLLAQSLQSPDCSIPVACTMKIKASTPLKKVFEAAEVSGIAFR